jgi:hypothetical protein
MIELIQFGHLTLAIGRRVRNVNRVSGGRMLHLDADTRVASVTNARKLGHHARWLGLCFALIAVASPVVSHKWINRHRVDCRCASVPVADRSVGRLAPS